VNRAGVWEESGVPMSSSGTLISSKGETRHTATKSVEATNAQALKGIHAQRMLQWILSYFLLYFLIIVQAVVLAAKVLLIDTTAELVSFLPLLGTPLLTGSAFMLWRLTTAPVTKTQNQLELKIFSDDLEEAATNGEQVGEQTPPEDRP
jgi:hypothetical protein